MREGYFGPYGGQYVPETLMPALEELEAAYEEARQDKAFQQELAAHLDTYVGRPTPLYLADRLSQRLGGARVYLKREDLCHTGAHKINNSLGQALLAKRMGKRRLIAETGAGQHGVATATVAALLGLECHVYMGEIDMERQALNVVRMRLLGTEVIPVRTGSRTLKDAINEAIRDWVTNVRDTHYVIGSVVGPHPYPVMVRDFQAIIGSETRRQIQETAGRLPDYIVACVGGGSNSMGIFYPFLEDSEVKLVGVEAAGEGIATGRHAASLVAGSRGVLHGALSYLLQDPWGQIRIAHSVSAGLDYPGVGPEHSFLRDSGRVTYTAVTDSQALEAFQLLAATEGILPALESAHAVAQVVAMAPQLRPEDLVVINLSGRGDKDVETVAQVLHGGLPEAETLPSAPSSGEKGPAANVFSVPVVPTSRPAGRERLDYAFTNCRERGEKALIVYLCAGDPSLEATVELVEVAARGGADVIELGVPFSDPLADGPVIQAASQRALARGLTLADAWRLAGEISSRVDVPVVLMGYYNPFLQYGLERLAADAAASGISGLIVPDLPAEESRDLAGRLGDHGLAYIPLVAPTSTPARLAKLASLATGFVYCVSVTGVTGMRDRLDAGLAAFTGQVRRYTSRPLAIGFGISTPAQAGQAAAAADGVIVGSALVDIAYQVYGRPGWHSAFGERVSALKKALSARWAGR